QLDGWVGRWIRFVCARRGGFARGARNCTRGGCAPQRNVVRVDDNATAAMAECGPAIRLAKDILGRKLDRAHLFVAPEHIALWMTALGEQPIRQSDGLHRLAVVNGFDLEAGFLLELAQNRLGIDLVLRGVNDYPLWREVKARE